MRKTEHLLNGRELIVEVSAIAPALSRMAAVVRITELSRPQDTALAEHLTVCGSGRLMIIRQWT